MMDKPSMTIRVLLVDDHGVLRDGLRAILTAEPDIMLVGEAADGPAALQAIVDLTPDVVLLDVSLPGMSGLEVLQRAAQSQPSVRIVMLSMRDEPATVGRALQLGALGFLSKGAPAREVLAALRSVAAGQRYLPPHLASPVVEAMLQSRQQQNGRNGAAPAESPLAALSLRERQVMQALCEGRSSAEIAATLAVSSKTVDTYRARLMGKLGVRDLASLVRLAMREGLIGDL